ncbi:MAG: ABC transporter substrate-binding protein, partial [Candidatus Hodarchaeales archaeon]
MTKYKTKYLLNPKIRYFFVVFLPVIIIITPIADSGITPHLLLKKDANITDMSFIQTLPNILFNISLLSPNNIPNRNQFVELIAEELPKIGIGITLNDNAEWSTIMARIFDYDVNPVTGYHNYSAIPTYDEGGYDILFYGSLWHNTMRPTRLLASFSSNPTWNRNIQWYQNATIEQLIADYWLEPDEIKQMNFLEQIQAILYQDLPTIPIVYSADGPWLINENWTLSKEEWQAIETKEMRSAWANFGFNDISSIIIGGMRETWLPTPITYEIQERSTKFALGMVWQGLYESNFTDQYNIKPLLTKSMPSWSNNYKTATVELQNDVFFADGHQLTAHDVVETFRIMLTPRFKAWNYDLLLGSPVVAPNGSTVPVYPHFASNESIVALDNFTVRFTWSAPYCLALDLLTIPILPIHIWGNHTHPTTSLDLISLG